MKKFNSTLAIAAIALTSVFGFTSCDKNDDVFDYNPQPQRIEMHTETSGYDNQYETNTTCITGTDTVKTTTTNVSANDTESADEDYAGPSEARRRWGGYVR